MFYSTEETHRTFKHPPPPLVRKQEETQTGPCCRVHSSSQVMHTKGWMKCQEIGQCRERKGKVEIDSSRESRKGSSRGRIGTALGGRVSGAMHFKEWYLSRRFRAVELSRGTRSLWEAWGMPGWGERSYSVLRREWEGFWQLLSGKWKESRCRKTPGW